MPNPKNNQNHNLSYAKTASTDKKIHKKFKNQKNIKNIKYNTDKYNEISLKHLLNNSQPTKLNQICMGGSDRRICCNWHQFSGNTEEAIDYVSDSIGGSFVTVKHNNFKKVIYFMFDKLEEAQNFIKPLLFIKIGSECNITPTWNDITIALKTTPNSKAAGIDSILSKF
ncbi:hypothetical protein BB561_004894 [Smittium simulii]|uniref:Uncharacterized protein n=1 Tax=Smittium simulii TaxID=133385 RepID=A0A2T9YDK5_9FUNG|nr:hypothetical protein BB561_004894 [Smittium simulii]